MNREEGIRRFLFKLCKTLTSTYSVIGPLDAHEEQNAEISASATIKLCNYLQSINDTQLLPEAMREGLTAVLRTLSQERYLDSVAEDDVVRVFLSTLKTYRAVTKCLFQLFECLQEHYKAHGACLEGVAKECYVQFFREYSPRLMEVALAVIDRQRKGEDKNRGFIAQVSASFALCGLEVYKSEFEEPLLEKTKDFYILSGSQWISELKPYLKKAQVCFKKEEAIAHYWKGSCKVKLLTVVRNEILAVALKALFRDIRESPFAQMHLSVIRGFVLDIPECIDHLRPIFQEHFMRDATYLVKEAQDAEINEVDYVHMLMDLYDNYYLPFATSLCLNKDVVLLKVLKDGFEQLFSSGHLRGMSIAEVIAAFFNHMLKKGSRAALREESIEETFEKAFKLVAFVVDKDLFCESYRKHHGHRLLLDRCATEEQEFTILSKLKMEFGYFFTSKMEIMVEDMNLAKKLEGAFQEYLSRYPNLNPTFDFSVTLLYKNCWPSYKTLPLNLPTEMGKGIQTFDNFFRTNTSRTKTRRKRQEWNFALGTGHVDWMYHTTTFELVVTTPQAVTLLLFNESDGLTIKDIESQLNLSEENDVAELVNSLSSKKGKVLIFNKALGIYEVNPEFTSNKRRIMLIAPPCEEKKAIDVVDINRRCQIDATIVRIMKTRRVLQYTELCTECVQHLRMFKPDVKIVKRRIESLIEREFLERAKDDISILKYLP